MADSKKELLSLPNELLLDIADVLDSSADLNAPIQANKSTHSVLNGTLYCRDAKGDKAVALFMAAEFGLLKTAQLSLEQGADVSISRTFPSYHFDKVRLLRAGDEITVSSLLVALACKQESLAVFLISRGANTEVRLRSNQGLSTLHIASGLGLTTIMQILLDKGGRVDSRDDAGATSLHHAVVPALHGKCFGKPKAVALLLQHGASITAVDQEGTTPEGLISSTHYNHRVPPILLPAPEDGSLSKERQIQALLEGARAAMELKKLEKSRVKKKAQKVARDRAKVEEARKKGQAHARKLKEDAERKSRDEEAMRKARDGEAVRARKRHER